MGIFSSLHIGARSLYLNQLALEVTGHNIANVNTEGYTRQRVEQEAGVPTTYGFGPLGTGVMLDQIIRTTDTFMANQVAKENQLLGQRMRENDVYQRIEKIFNEPDENNFSTILGNFFDSVNTLSFSPEDTSIRAVVVENGNVLAETINNFDEQLEDIRERIDEVIALQVSEVNAKTSQIAELNEKISRSEIGGNYQANDYRDEREKLVRELQEIMDVSVVPDGTSSNTLSVTIRGIALVHRNTSYDIEASLNSNNHYDIQTVSSGDILDIRGGEFKGYLDGRDTIVPYFQDKMDTLSKAIIEEVNRIHSRGVGLTGFSSVTAGNAVSSSTAKLNAAGLTFTPQDGSFYISVFDRDKNLIEQQQITFSASANSLEDIRASIDAMTNITATISLSDQKLTISADGASSGMTFTFTDDSDTATGDTGDLLMALGINTFFTGSSASDIEVNTVVEDNLDLIAAAKQLSPGDNANALDMVNLRGRLTMSNNTSSFDDYYASIVGLAGTQAQQSNNQYETSKSIVELLQQRWQESVGVSLDEEVINMIKYQRVYQASAKFVAGVNEMLLSLFNSF